MKACWDVSKELEEHRAVQLALFKRELAHSSAKAHSCVRGTKMKIYVLAFDSCGFKWLMKSSTEASFENDNKPLCFVKDGKELLDHLSDYQYAK
jgi:hypothetical protein